MDSALIFFFGFILGLGVALLLYPRPNKKELTLTMALQLDATQPVSISAVGRDSEGNVINLADTDLTIVAEATEGNFGNINDELDTFNPGEAGATGTIRGTVTINDVEYTAAVEVELVAGGLDTISLEFTPTEDEE